MKRSGPCGVQTDPGQGLLGVHGLVHQPSPHIEVVAGGQVFIQAVGVAHDADASAHGQAMDVGVQAKQAQRAAGHGQQGGEHVQQRAFAAAVCPDHQQAFAWRDIQVHTRHGPAATEAATQVAGLDDGGS